MTVTSEGATRYAGARVNRVEDVRLLTGRGTYVDDIALPGMLHACFVRSPFARAAIRGIDATAARAMPGVHHVFTAADLNPDVKAQWHTSLGPDGPETPRPPLADTEVRFVGDPVALVVAESRYLAEDAAELVDVDYEPLVPVVDYAEAEHATTLVHEGHGSNIIGEMAGLPASALEDVFASAAHVTSETIRQQAYVPAPMEGRGLARRLLARYRRPHHLLGDAVAARGAHVLLPPARGAGTARPRRDARHRRRFRAEDHGPARRDVRHARRTEGRRTAEVGGGPQREPHRGGPVAPRARRRRDGVRRRRRDPGGPHRLRVGLRRVPDAVAGGDIGGGRLAVPGSLPGAARELHDEGDVLEHRRPRSVPRAVGVRVARARGSARYRGAPDGHGPGRAPSSQPAAPRRAALRESEWDALRQHHATGDVRTGAGDARLRRVPCGAGGGPRRGPVSGGGVVDLRRAVDTGLRLLRHRSGDDPDRALRCRQRLHRGRLHGKQHRDDGRPAHRRRPRREHRGRRDRSRATRHSPASVAAPPAAAVGR